MAQTFKHGDSVLLPDWLGGGSAEFDRYEPDNPGTFATMMGWDMAVVKVAGAYIIHLYARHLRPVPKPEPGIGEFHTDSAGVVYVNTGDRAMLTGRHWVRLEREALGGQVWYTWAELRDR